MKVDFKTNITNFLVEPLYMKTKIVEEFGDLSEEEMTEFLFTLKTMIGKKLDEEN